MQVFECMCWQRLTTLTVIMPSPEPWQEIQQAMLLFALTASVLSLGTGFAVHATRRPSVELEYAYSMTEV